MGMDTDTQAMVTGMETKIRLIKQYLSKINNHSK